ncbi:MAG: PQQ-dependent sugar dehydrogenase, partial [Phycisphaerales bacterium]|nr:PQQ-dependent sugar dehydrogenase [Phycisphaerales bacterium]
MRMGREMRAAWLIGAMAAGVVAMSTCSSADSSTAAVQDDAASSSSSSSSSIPQLLLEPAYPGLSFDRPVDAQWAPGDTDHVYVVEQSGRIIVFDDRNDVTESKVFLDLRQNILRSHNEEGLLSLAFHPKFAENRQLFVYYSAGSPRRGLVSRFTVSEDDRLTVEPGSETIILSVEQPWPNHNGSTLVFGPDGYLYISLGDGGYANDPKNSGQDRSTLLGSILRIDIDRSSGDIAYAVPDDNPFVGRDGIRPEIWAYGLRNVWRMSFDRETGALWAADVGQNRWEEVNIITKGGNYGWRLREGMHPFAKGEADDDAPLIEPVAEYSHNEGLSITGGYVY